MAASQREKTRTHSIDLTALETSNNPVGKEAARKLTAYLAGKTEQLDLTEAEKAVVAEELTGAAKDEPGAK